MAERSLRGSRLGTQSFEDEHGVEMAPRQEVEYVTESGEVFSVTMSVEAEIPTQWEHPKTGALGRLVNGPAPELVEEKPVRTHWDMLLERRSRPELEDILTERLLMLRAGEIGPANLHRVRKPRPASKKAVAKKAPANKKPAAKKPAVKKTATKKSAVKTSAVKTSTAKKTAARKTTAKRG